MSNVFSEYEEEYDMLLASLPKKFSSAFALKGEQKKQKLSEITSDLKNAEILIWKMDLAANSLPPNIKSILLVKLREFKSNLKSLKSKIITITSENINAYTSDELQKANMADTMMTSEDQRSRLMKSTEDLVRTTSRIEDSERKMQETEQIGVSMLQSLRSQRVSLQNNQETFRKIDAKIEESESTFKEKKSFFTRNKEYVAVVGAFIIYIIIKLIK